MDITISPVNEYGNLKQSFTNPNTIIHIKVISLVVGDIIENYFNSKTPITLTDLNPEDKVIISVTGTLINETININSTGNQYLTVENMTQKVGTMATSFSGNNRLTRVNASDSDMSNVTSMHSAFYQCNNLTSIELPNSLSNVTFMYATFSGCTSLTSVTLPDDLSNVTNMDYTFGYCSSLTNITLPDDLSNVGNMNQTFAYCTSLTNTSPLNMEFPNVTAVDSCWENCTNFNGNLSNWKFRSNVTRTGYDSNTPNWLPEHKPQFVL